MVSALCRRYFGGGRGNVALGAPAVQGIRVVLSVS